MKYRIVATPVAACALAFLLAACAGDKPQYVERPVEELYNEAVDLLAQGELKTAAAAFDEVERQHPYSSWATKAQIMSAFSHYQAGEYDEAILAAAPGVYAEMAALAAAPAVRA